MIFYKLNLAGTTKVRIYFKDNSKDIRKVEGVVNANGTLGDIYVDGRNSTLDELKNVGISAINYKQPAMVYYKGIRLMNLIYFYRQNILLSSADAIVIPVNCVGVMGAGLALQAAKKYPEMLKKYKQYCDRELLKPGNPQVITYPRKAVLFPTKNHWKNNSKIEWIIKGLETLRASDGLFTSLAIPPLGCGLGGLIWKDVEKEIHKAFKGCLCEIHIYSPELC